MRALNLITLALLIIGGLDLGFIGLARTDFIAAFFGERAMAARLCYDLIGLAALWQLVLFARGEHAPRRWLRWPVLR